MIPSEAVWEPFDNGVELLLGYIGSPTWNKVLQSVPWELRDDLYEGRDPELSSHVLASGAVFDWQGVVYEGSELPFDIRVCEDVFSNNPRFRRDVWDRAKEIGLDQSRAKYGDAENVAEYVRWHLSYGDFSQDKLHVKIARGELKGYRIIDLKPEITSRQEDIYDAYVQLTQTREAGMSAPTRIKLSDIIEYAEHGLTSVPKDVLVPAILAADNAFQEWWQQTHQTSQ